MSPFSFMAYLERINQAGTNIFPDIPLFFSLHLLELVILILYAYKRTIQLAYCTKIYAYNRILCTLVNALF